MRMDTTSNTGLTASGKGNSLELLFPKFGTPSRALDIPSWDAGKGMYLVDQYQAQSGNRSLTYVGVSEQLLVEVTLGHYHSWEYINKVRAMVYDVDGFRVICSHDWEQSTHFNMGELRSELSSGLSDYVIGSGLSGGKEREYVQKEVEKILDDLFSKDVMDLDRGGIRRILMAYCRKKNVCHDFTGNGPVNWNSAAALEDWNDD